MKRVLIFIFSLLSFTIRAQTISTFVGNGIPDNTGEGGPATAATIAAPAGGTFDKLGNYYFGSTSRNIVYKVDKAGIINVVAGSAAAAGSFSGDGGPATDAGLNNPSAIAIDTIGNIYIADAYNWRVRKVDITTGMIYTIAGNGGTGYSGDGGPATAAMVYDPNDLCFDKTGNLYITEAPNYVVRKVNTTGIISTIAGTPNVYGFSGDGGQATAAKLDEITGICIDQEGNLYLADFANGRVRKINAEGIITTVAGIGGSLVYSGDGGPATEASVSPERITVDKFGNLFITSYISNRVRLVNKTGYINTICGNGIAAYNGDNIPAASAELNYPSGLTVDSCDNLYIADLANNRIRKVTYSKCNYLAVPELITNPNELCIYPNPANNLLNINNLKTESNYCLLSIVGALLQQGTLRAGNNSISIQALPGGMYLLEVSPLAPVMVSSPNQGQGEKTVTKIIKQ